MAKILGISGLYHDSASALVVDGEIVAAAQEERFSRIKHDSAFPNCAAGYCMGMINDDSQLDAVVYYEDPILSFDRVIKNLIETAPASQEIWADTAKSQLGVKLRIEEELRKCFPHDVGDIFFCDHHLSHAASAFYPSPFNDAAFVVTDGVGEWATTSIGYGKDTNLTITEQVCYPHSLGLFYSAFTYHCGLKVNSGEYKLMGMAPYGEPNRVNDILDNMIDLRDDGSFRLNMDYFGFMTSGVTTNNAFEELLGCQRLTPDGKISKKYIDIAASAQIVIEEAIKRIARRALKGTGSSRLCMAGGVALNCVVNGKLLRDLPNLEELWIQPASGDAGGALGAALYLAHSYYKEKRHSFVGKSDGQKGSLLGPSFDNVAVEKALLEHGLRYEHIESDDEFNVAIAQGLSSGKIVGRFDGPMEFGPRALGNRSIIADPRRDDGQSYINIRIKFRESWRPFAPVILAEKVNQYFDIRGESPYMLIVGAVLESHRLPIDMQSMDSTNYNMLEMLNKKRSDIPSVTHIDYSARVQTIDAARNPRFYRLLSAFDALTGCPVLINTSFNVRGEPIVCTPEDAIKCFLNTGIDILIMNNFIVKKVDQVEELKNMEGGTVYEPD